MMGCNSYAGVMVEPNLAKSPKVVTSFLQELSKTVKPKADEVSWHCYNVLCYGKNKILVTSFRLRRNTWPLETSKERSVVINLQS